VRSSSGPFLQNFFIDDASVLSGLGTTDRDRGQRKMEARNRFDWLQRFMQVRCAEKLHPLKQEAQ